jgi:hypothetical protein
MDMPQLMEPRLCTMTLPQYMSSAMEFKAMLIMVVPTLLTMRTAMVTPPMGNTGLNFPMAAHRLSPTQWAMLTQAMLLMLSTLEILCL